MAVKSVDAVSDAEKDVERVFDWVSEVVAADCVDRVEVSAVDKDVVAVPVVEKASAGVDRVKLLVDPVSVAVWLCVSLAVTDPERVEKETGVDVGEATTVVWVTIPMVTVDVLLRVVYEETKPIVNGNKWTMNGCNLSSL